MNRLILTLTCLLTASAALPQEQPSFTVRGVNRTATITAADLAGFPQHRIQTLDHGKPASFEGVLLWDVLQKVDLPVGDKYHSTSASYYLLAEGKDGYRALYAWAELSPEFMDKPVYVVTKREGKPLPASAQPFQLVAPGEKRGGRWLRQLKSLTIQQVK